MSGMADEMARRIAEDGGDLGAAPGNEGGTPPEPQSPPAEALSTDTTDGRTPETIPYARFKEVNDRYQGLKDFEELQGYGYDADSLRRLAAFESSYLQDPTGTTAAMVDNLDLPQEAKDAIKEHLGAQNPGSAEGEPSTVDTPAAAPLPPEVQERLQYVDQLRAREEEQAREAQLQAVVAAWDELDKKDEIKTPEKMKLMAIAATAQSGGNWRTYEDLAKDARSSLLEYRSDVLGSAVRTGRGGSPPASLPGSAPGGSGPVKFASIREATKAAEAAIARGELPSISE
jgi:DNA-binding protein H-NS